MSRIFYFQSDPHILSPYCFNAKNWYISEKLILWLIQLLKASRNFTRSIYRNTRIKPAASYTLQVLFWSWVFWFSCSLHKKKPAFGLHSHSPVMDLLGLDMLFLRKTNPLPLNIHSGVCEEISPFFLIFYWENAASMLQRIKLNRNYTYSVPQAIAPISLFINLFANCYKCCWHPP